MTYWAILSGIEGNLAAYEAVLSDLKRQRLPVSELYILGDLIGPTPDSETLVKRVRSPRSGEWEPQVCVGWWEEQCFILHGLSAESEPTDCLNRYGGDTVKQLWESVPRSTVQWLRSLDFGFFELDCMLIHGSTISVADELTPETSPLQMLDRLIRAEANTLFCGRSGLSFQYQLASGTLASQITTLDSRTSNLISSNPTRTTTQQTVQPKQIIGVGNIGRIPGQATYTLYHPALNQVVFKTVRYGNKGFRPNPR
jgi:hypothetical protein